MPPNSLDIIFFSLTKWNGPFSSTAFSLAKEMAKTHRTFYIDNPFTIKDVIQNFNSGDLKNQSLKLLSGKGFHEKIDEIEGNFIAATPPAMIPLNFIKWKGLYNSLFKLNNKRFEKFLFSLLKTYKVKDFILINSYNPFYLNTLPEGIAPKLFIYHCVDDIAHSKYVGLHGARLEEKILKNCDFTITTSKELKRIKTPYTKKIYCIPNAADIELFKTAHDDLEKPFEIKSIQTPVIIYIGNLDNRIDYKLVKEIARVHKDKTLLLVGPSTYPEYKTYGIDKLENVVLTGRKQLKELPAYLKFADCAIIPFRCNTLTKSIYPLKINEYLAAGKAVISTKFSADISDFKNSVFLAEDSKQFIEFIQKGIDTDSEKKKQERISAAENNSWSNRVKLLWQIIDENLKTL